LTIAAVDCGEGRSLFPDRGSPSETPIAQLLFHPNPGPGSRSFGRSCVYPILKDSVFHNYRDIISNSKLLTRAWVFQEWALSRRILCATPFGLLMQCRSGKVSNNKLENIDSRQKLKEMPPELMLKRSISFNKSSILGVWELWYNFVSLYSGTTPNKTKDRVAAISRVASEILEVIKLLNMSLPRRST
jgi:hypothetical protein